MPSVRVIDNPRFSLWAMLLAITAIGVYLGLLRWVGPLAFYFALAIWVVLLFEQLKPEARAAARIAAQAWGGIVVPLTLLVLPQHFGSTRGNVDHAFVYVFFYWIAGLTLWLVSQMIEAPKLTSFASGFLAVVGGIFVWVGSMLPWSTTAIAPPNESTVPQTILALAQVTACVLAGLLSGGTFLAAAVQTWRKSRRIGKPSVLAFTAGWLTAFIGAPGLVRFLL